MRSYFVETWGCQMNVLDSQRLEGVLQARGLRPAARARGGRRGAAQHLRGAGEVGPEGRLAPRRAAAMARRRTACRAWSGCAAAWPSRTARRSCGASRSWAFVLGPGHVEDLGDGPRRRGRTASAPVVTGFELRAAIDPDLIARPDSARQYVTVIHGCNQHCTYCVVPHTRGAEVSRTAGRDRGGGGAAGAGAVPGRSPCWDRRSTPTDAPRPVPTSPSSCEAVADVDGLWQRAVHHLAPPLLHARAWWAPWPACRASGRTCTCRSRPARIACSGAWPGATPGSSYLDVVETLRAASPRAVLLHGRHRRLPRRDRRRLRGDAVAWSRTCASGSSIGFVFSPRRGTAAAGASADVDPRDVAAGTASSGCSPCRPSIQLDLNRALVGREVEVLVDGPARRGAPLAGRGRDNRVVNFDGWPGHRPPARSSTSSSPARPRTPCLGGWRADRVRPRQRRALDSPGQVG